MSLVFTHSKRPSHVYNIMYDWIAVRVKGLCMGADSYARFYFFIEQAASCAIIS